MLNTGAWVDAPAGQWSTSAPFYNDFRWQRQPSENMNFGRNFRFGSDGRFNLFVRAEFTNIFNRTFLAPPVSREPERPDLDNQLSRCCDQQWRLREYHDVPTRQWIAAALRHDRNPLHVLT